MEMTGFKLGLGMALLLATCGAISLYAIRQIDKQACAQVGIEISLPTKYRYPTGCYVKDGDRWMQLRRYNSVKLIKE